MKEHDYLVVENKLYNTMMNLKMDRKRKKGEKLSPEKAIKLYREITQIKDEISLRVENYRDEEELK